MDILVTLIAVTLALVLAGLFFPWVLYWFAILAFSYGEYKRARARGRRP